MKAAHLRFMGGVCATLKELHMIPRLQPNMRVCLVYANLGARLAWPVAPAVRAFINRADHELFYFWKPSNFLWKISTQKSGKFPEI